MRVALISLSSPVEDQPRVLRGELALAGRSLAERQLELALAAGCERVLCLADRLDPPMIALQLKTEAAGAKFALAGGARGLIGQVGVADEFLVLADGLLPAADEAQAALGKGSGVLVLPVEAGVAAGFERIDLNHAWAGILVMPGGLVERLSELPPDCDAVAALLRIALQGRVPERELPEKVLAEGRWAMIRGPADLAAIEPGWFRRHASPASIWAPGKALARLAAAAFGPAMVARGAKGAGVSASGAVLALLGVVAAWRGLTVTSFAAVGLGWMLAEAGASLRRIARGGLVSTAGRSWNGLLGWLVDAALVSCFALAISGDLLSRLFLPTLLLGLLRLAEGQVEENWRETLSDRALLALSFALAAWWGPLAMVGEVLALGALVALWLRLRAEPRLTQA